MSDQQRQGREQRVFRRTEFSTTVEIEVEDPGTDAAAVRVAEGQIVDVGVGGVLARLGEGVPVGTLCTVRFAEPEIGELETRGYVRRLSADEGGGFLVGIEFETPLEALRTPAEGDRLEGFDLTSTKVLVVDDEASVVELLYRFLTSLGCEVHTASSGEEALAALREGAHDITVLDLRMPGMDGLEVLDAIREENLDAGTVWAVSGYATDAEARQALRHGAVDFISKPLDLKYLEWSMQLHYASC
jgi:CheY-like chemotaxis protein